jgi:malonyl-CoA O-methyltransferase
MADADNPRSSLRPIDAAALTRIGRRRQHPKPAPWLHGEVARRMAERLAVASRTSASTCSINARRIAAGIVCASCSSAVSRVAVTQLRSIGASATRSAGSSASKPRLNAAAASSAIAPSPDSPRCWFGCCAWADAAQQTRTQA